MSDSLSRSQVENFSRLFQFQTAEQTFQRMQAQIERERDNLNRERQANRSAEYQRNQNKRIRDRSGLASPSPRKRTRVSHQQGGSGSESEEDEDVLVDSDGGIEAVGGGDDDEQDSEQAQVERWYTRVQSILNQLESDFEEKRRLSHPEHCFHPVSDSMKRSTVKSFYKAFHDQTTMPLETCTFCYCKFSEKELNDISWCEELHTEEERQQFPQTKCRRCFPLDQVVSICNECKVQLFKKKYPSRGAKLHGLIRCEHERPQELSDLTPIEERIIALHSCYGLVACFSPPEYSRNPVKYNRHFKGHITVFPNNVQNLVSRVLPHPRVQVLKEVYVSWQVSNKPTPEDLSRLLSV
jgi:hypothetical protein